MSAGGQDNVAPRPPGPPPPRPPQATADPDVHHDIARDIGQQVEIMILDAKHNSESKVGKEIQKIKTKMESIQAKIRQVQEKLASVEPGGGGLHKNDLQKSIAKLEEVWEGEVGTLKHELWQTIQAHNHNADLLKHHKDAIDQVQGRMTESTPNPELDQVHAQLMQVDKVHQRELQKEQQFDQLMQRLTIVQQSIQTATGMGHAGPWPGMHPPFPMTGQPQNAAAAAAAAAQTAPKAKSRNKAKAKGKASSQSQAAQAANHLRAEAPEFVPTFSGVDGA